MALARVWYSAVTKVNTQLTKAYVPTVYMPYSVPLLWAFEIVDNAVPYVYIKIQDLSLSCHATR